MKVVERATTPSGVLIQREDWEDHYLIGAYPIAKNYSKYELIKRGHPFRLTITTDDVFSDFDALKTGEKALEDMSSQFWNGEKDMFYLGMKTDYYE